MTPREVSARFHPGQRVKVLELNKGGHVRTPYYTRNKEGVVESIVGFYLHPEDLSVGKTCGPSYPVYRIEFSQAELWSGYSDNPEDKLFLEVYENWLEAAESADPSGGRSNG